jgi:carboxyl-terminal processing protease
MPLRNFLLILAVALQAALTWQRVPLAGQDEELYEYYRLLVDVLDRVEKNYVQDVDRKELLKGAVQGMLRTLDPYSEFIPPEEFTEFQQQTEGHFGGVGIVVDFDAATGHLVVISPLPDSPAFKAGILAGDRIVAVDGEPLEKLGPNKALDKIRGPVGTTVTLKVLRTGETEPIDVTLTREDIKIESVKGVARRPDGKWDWILDKEHGIAYIRLTQFVDATAEDLKRALKEAREQGMKGLILDLRFNPGGLLESAIEVSDLFLKTSQTIVSVRGRNVRSQEWKATGRGPCQDVPLVVLVNRHSASASEIVAAALQDHKRAVIVGTRTWGKGSVQNVIQLADGKGALKLTTAEYYRPTGKNIHRRTHMTEQDEWGVVPDVVTPEIPPAQVRVFFDMQQQRDIIPNEKLAKQKAARKVDFKDIQLEKALEVLRDLLRKQAPGS